MCIAAKLQDSVIQGGISKVLGVHVLTRTIGLVLCAVVVRVCMVRRSYVSSTLLGDTMVANMKE